MIERLTPKVASFFQMGFDGAVKQLADRGYPPAEEDTSFLEYQKALLEYPTEEIDL